MIYIQPIREDVPPPRLASAGAAGYDLYAATNTTLYPGCTEVIPTGWAMQIPDGYVGLVRDRSSMARYGLAVGAGVIDSDYRGEIAVVITNTSDAPRAIEAGARFAQLLILPVLSRELEIVDQLDETARGDNGFGSTGQR